MNNSQSAALIMLGLVALVFWLFNTRSADGRTRLQAVASDITGAAPPSPGTVSAMPVDFSQVSGGSLLPTSHSTLGVMSGNGGLPSQGPLPQVGN